MATPLPSSKTLNAGSPEFAWISCDIAGSIDKDVITNIAKANLVFADVINFFISEAHVWVHFSGLLYCGFKGAAISFSCSLFYGALLSPTFLFRTF